MAHKHLYTWDVIERKYHGWPNPSTLHVNPSFKMKEEDTYYMVFGPDQKDLLTVFKEHFGEHIIFEGEPAQNTHYEPGPRNTLIIFEKKK